MRSRPVPCILLPATIDTAGAAKAESKDNTAPKATEKAPAETPEAEAAPSTETPKAEAAPSTEAPKQPVQKEASTPEAKDSYASGTPSPAAEKILDEKNIAPADVQGTGRDGRITKNDAVQAQALAVAPSAPAQTPQNNTPVQGGTRNEHREKMSTLRKTIAKRLVEAKNLTAMLTTFNEVDMTAVMEMRKKYKDAFKDKYGIGLGFMSIFTRAVCEAIKEFPAVNSKIEDTDLVYHDYVDMGIAVSTPRGLVVPVVRNVENMSLADIEKNIADLAGRARDNKLTIEEMTGGTFTITNGGVFGSLMSTPILNAPQSAILGMHNIVDRPVALNGQVVIRPMMYLALSYDHRVIDGRESVSFLVKIKQYIEDPMRLILEV